jgi:hypothetical protein
MTTTAAASPGSAVATATPRTAERFLALLRTALVVALSALVLAIGALAYLVSFEAIRAFAIQTAAFPPSLAWAAPLLVDSFTTAATLVILWRYLRGEPWFAAWYAWSLVAAATAVSVALNVAHAPPTLGARLLAAVPPIALLGAIELLMSVARCGLHPTIPVQPKPAAAAPTVTAVRATRPTTDRSGASRMPQLTTGHTADRTAHGRSAGNGTAPRSPARAAVRALVDRERSGGPRVTVAEAIDATGLKERRAYELLRDARSVPAPLQEGPQ